jgi:hypothetical protein
MMGRDSALKEELERILGFGLAYDLYYADRSVMVCAPVVDSGVYRKVDRIVKDSGFDGGYTLDVSFTRSASQLNVIAIPRIRYIVDRNIVLPYGGRIDVEDIRMATEDIEQAGGLLKYDWFFEQLANRVICGWVQMRMERII